MIEAIKYIILIFLLDQVLLTILKKTNPKLRKLVFLSIIVVIYGVFYELAINRLPDNYFEVFSVDRIVAPDTLKKSFRKLSLKYHPDRAAQENVDPNLFQTIRFQYETLQDENSRALYDKFGPEAVHQFKLDQKNQVPERTFGRYQRRILKQDGIYYMVFAVAFIAMCSDERLNKCRKLCLILVLAFYGLEASFLWVEQQIPDAIDSVFSSYAIWERIEILKGLIGLVCITIKLALQMGLRKPDADIKLKLKHIKELQENINHKARTVEVGTLVKHCNGDSEFKKQLAEIEQLTKEAAKICEDNNTEQKKEVKKKRKRRIKMSVMTVLVVTWAYYFAPF